MPTPRPQWSVRSWPAPRAVARRSLRRLEPSRRGRVRDAVRFRSWLTLAAWCHRVPGRCFYVPARGRGLVVGRRWVLRPLLGLSAGPELACPAWLRARSRATAAPRQLPGAGAVAVPGRGLGRATPGSQRRQHEEIVDGDAGMTAALLHLSRAAASKLTILPLRSSTGCRRR